MSSLCVCVCVCVFVCVCGFGVLGVGQLEHTVCMCVCLLSIYRHEVMCQVEIMCVSAHVTLVRMNDCRNYILVVHCNLHIDLII